MNATPTTFNPITLRLAQALAGDGDALRWAATEPGLDEAIRLNRLGPTLAGTARDLAVRAPRVDSWREQLRSNAAFRMVLEQSKLRLGETLGREGIPWVPLKGMGLPDGVYRRPEERATTDLDVLIDDDNLDASMRLLTGDGWDPSMNSRMQRAFTLEEGYNWKATLTPGVNLELHFRLWGSVPERMGRGVLERAIPEPSWGGTARRVSASDAYVIAATHVWLTPPPRYLFLWWDLERIAAIATDTQLQEIIEITRTEGLQLFVYQSAIGAATLWNCERHGTIARALEPDLRWPERTASHRFSRVSQSRLPLGALVLARLLAGRPSRMGWRAPFRRIWAHPGIVESHTPSDWPWAKRRLTHLLRQLGLSRR